MVTLNKETSDFSKEIERIQKEIEHKLKKLQKISSRFKSQSNALEKRKLEIDNKLETDQSFKNQNEYNDFLRDYDGFKNEMQEKNRELEKIFLKMLHEKDDLLPRDELKDILGILRKTIR